MPGQHDPQAHSGQSVVSSAVRDLSTLGKAPQPTSSQQMLSSLVADTAVCRSDPPAARSQFSHSDCDGLSEQGLLPFGSIFIEMYFIFTSFWNYKCDRPHRSHAVTVELHQHQNSNTVCDLVCPQVLLRLRFHAASVHHPRHRLDLHHHRLVVLPAQCRGAAATTWLASPAPPSHYTLTEHESHPEATGNTTFRFALMQDYRWHWTSIASAASTAFYVYLYSLYYFFAKTK